MPELGSLCEFDPPHLADIRSWTLRKFRHFVILYRPMEDGVEVIRVVHGSQDMQSLLT
jgi:plasmid stabilization system protein ParE